MAEFQHWVPSVPVVMYHGTPQERTDLFKMRIKRNLENGRPTRKFPVVCTSYEMVLKDRALLSSVQWEFIIIVSLDFFVGCMFEGFKRSLTQNIG